MILCEPFLYRVLVQCSKLFFHFIKQKHLYYKVIEIRLQIDREHLVSLFVTHFVEQFDLESKVTKLWKMSSLWIKKYLSDFNICMCSGAQVICRMLVQHCKEGPWFNCKHYKIQQIPQEEILKRPLWSHNFQPLLEELIRLPNMFSEGLSVRKSLNCLAWWVAENDCLNC